jgi:hypothetical protein
VNFCSVQPIIRSSYRIMIEEHIDAVLEKCPTMFCAWRALRDVCVHLDLLKAFAIAFRNQIQESKNFPILTSKACLYICHIPLAIRPSIAAASRFRF